MNSSGESSILNFIQMNEQMCDRLLNMKLARVPFVSLYSSAIVCRLEQMRKIELFDELVIQFQ